MLILNHMSIIFWWLKLPCLDVDFLLLKSPLKAQGSSRTQNICVVAGRKPTELVQQSNGDFASSNQ